MQLRHRAALNGVQLDEVDSRIMISKIETADGKESIQNVSLWGDSVGSRVTSIHRDSLDITVKFHIRLKKRSMAEREEVIEKANTWALNGGWLTANYKSNRRIRVFRAQAAGAGDPWEWTKEYSIILRACGVPYWQEATPTTLRQQNVSSGTLVMGIGGSEKSVLDAEFRNTSGGTINSFSISTGEASMSFSDLGLGNGETLVIDHNDTGKKCLLRLRIRNTGGSYRSVLDKRTGSDDLYISPGVRNITFSAGGAGTMTAMCCGRFA